VFLQRGGEQCTPRGSRRNRPEQSGAVTAAALKKHTNTHSYRILLVGTCVLLSRLRFRRGVPIEISVAHVPIAHVLFFFTSDDSPLNLKMLGKLLKAVGHRCEEVTGPPAPN
jgi:hypothetical protein